MSVSAKVSVLSPLDAAFVQVYMAGCLTQWKKLPELAQMVYDAGGTVEQLRGCLRHLIVLAGYGPCLAATLALQKAKLLPYDTPAKVGGPAGDAFDLVYANVATAVRKKVHSADPALGEWIQVHAYGDVYSSPGLDLRRKQLLMCARLAQANMDEQLFGHAIAALRFGNTKDVLLEAISLAFEMSHAPSQDHMNAAINAINLAAAKYEKDIKDITSKPKTVEVTIPRDMDVRIPTFSDSIPDFSPDFHTETKGTADQLGDIDKNRDLFVWERLDPRFDTTTRTWKDE